MSYADSEAQEQSLRLGVSLCHCNHDFYNSRQCASWFDKVQAALLAGNTNRCTPKLTNERYATAEVFDLTVLRVDI